MALYEGMLFYLFVCRHRRAWDAELNKQYTPHRASFYMRPFHWKVPRDFGNVVSDSLKMALMDVFVPLSMYRHQRLRYIGCCAHSIYFSLKIVFSRLFSKAIYCASVKIKVLLRYVNRKFSVGSLQKQGRTVHRSNLKNINSKDSIFHKYICNIYILVDI